MFFVFLFEPQGGGQGEGNLDLIGPNKFMCGGGVVWEGEGWEWRVFVWE